MLVDLSMPLSPTTVPVPGHPQPTFAPLHLLERDGLRNTVMSLSLHTATHIDAPSHFIADGATIDEVAIDRFRRPGIRLDLTACEPGAAIGVAELVAAGFDQVACRGTTLILATGWADRAFETPQLYGGNPYLALDAAEAIASAGPSAIGLDFAVDRGKPFPNHVVLLAADVLLIENLMHLSELPRDGFTVSAFPLRIVGENGAPARVVAELEG
ncbi:MAG TPA: cyclase family protein [Actinomycetota bacterium]|nr:cyclase family protein [Actinomycetota bacterium]